MESPLALVLDEDRSASERTRDTLQRAGIEAVTAATPEEALEVLRVHPFAVVVATAGDGPAPGQRDLLAELCRLRAEDGSRTERGRIAGRSDAAEALRRRVHELATTRFPVLFVGEAGSGRRYAARCLHALSDEKTSLVVVGAPNPDTLADALAQGGVVFLAPLEELTWPAQEALAAALTDRRTRPRVIAATAVDPRLAADEGRLSPALVAAFGSSIVRVPPLRERRSDIAVLVRTFIEELRRLNRLPPLTVAPEALTALEGYGWPGNVRQLRSAVEAAVIVATEGTIQLKDLPDYVSRPGGVAVAEAYAEGRFREAKRVVVDAFERSYLEALLKRHAGNVTGAAEQSGMLRSALQRLLRKHELHSADFRLRAPRSYAS